MTMTVSFVKELCRMTLIESMESRSKDEKIRFTFR